jgi:hypothetical protein
MDEWGFVLEPSRQRPIARVYRPRWVT